LINYRCFWQRFKRTEPGHSSKMKPHQESGTRISSGFSLRCSRMIGEAGRFHCTSVGGN
jgi:hypothetical protein